MSTSPAAVMHISEWFIKPKQQIEERNRPVYLNTWDLAMLRISYIRRILLYPNPADESVDIDTLVDQLKEALSIALVQFHPLAGQLETRPLSETSVTTFIDPSKGPGVRFIQAAAIDLRLSDLLSSTDYSPISTAFFALPATRSALTGTTCHY